MPDQPMQLNGIAGIVRSRAVIRDQGDDLMKNAS
jgi:hypothetical protein